MIYKMTNKANRLMVGALILIIAVGSTGCDGDFLSTVPKDRVSSENFWTNERDFNTALNGAYSQMMGRDNDPLFFEGTTEIGYSHADWRRQHEYVMGRADAESG